MSTCIGKVYLITPPLMHNLIDIVNYWKFDSNVFLI